MLTESISSISIILMCFSYYSDFNAEIIKYIVESLRKHLKNSAPFEDQIFDVHFNIPVGPSKRIVILDKLIVISCFRIDVKRYGFVSSILDVQRR